MTIKVENEEEGRVRTNINRVKLTNMVELF
uniref:Uncharacterized protein n=1 Tax=Nelumbo nucifera TaxID=4432 RepID=A0A822ZLS7_NELNU|nr:TPA_asm: hypothetical protein HUJ06_004382 [Nelumbo nucifera]